MGHTVTTIDGGSNGFPVISFVSGEGSDSVLEGFTITHGSVVTGGGGIGCLGSSPTITGCIILIITDLGESPDNLPKNLKLEDFVANCHDIGIH